MKTKVIGLGLMIRIKLKALLSPYLVPGTIL